MERDAPSGPEPGGSRGSVGKILRARWRFPLEGNGESAVLAPLPSSVRFVNLAARRAAMPKHCPSCGVTVADQIRCPLCDASLVKVNLRRVLLWAIVMEEYFLLSVAIVRRGLSLM